MTVPHWILDVIGIGSPLVAVAYLVVQLMMKVAISDTNGLIRVHIAASEAKFSAIDKHLEFTDKRVDRLEDRES